MSMLDITSREGKTIHLQRLRKGKDLREGHQEGINQEREGREVHVKWKQRNMKGLSQTDKEKAMAMEGVD